MPITYQGGIPVQNYGKQNPSSLGEALGAGLAIFNTASKYRTDAANRDQSLASAAKTRLEAQILQDKMEAMQGMEDNFKTIYAGAPVPVPDILPSPDSVPTELGYHPPMITPPDMRYKAAAGISRVNPAIDPYKMLQSQRQGDMFNSGAQQIQSMPDSVTKAAIQATVGQGKAFPSLVDIKQDTMFNPFDMEAKTRMLTGANGQPVINKKIFDMENTLNKDSLKYNAVYRDASTNFEKIKTLYDGDSSIADVGMIFALMKLYDPGSTVREGEYAQAANAGGVPAEIRSLYNRFFKEGRLPAPIRDQIMGVANDMHANALGRYEQNINNLENRVNLYPGLQWNRVHQPMVQPSVAAAVEEVVEPDNLQQRVVLPEGDAGKEVYDKLPSQTDYIWGNVKGTKP